MFYSQILCEKAQKAPCFWDFLSLIVFSPIITAASMKICISDGLRTRISGVMTVGLAVSIVGLQGIRYFRMAYAKKSLSSIC